MSDGKMVRTIKYKIKLDVRPNIAGIGKLAGEYKIPLDTTVEFHGFANGSPGAVEFIKEETLEAGHIDE